MRAMMLHSQGELNSASLTKSDIPIPAPEADELLLKVSSCGVCHTDLHTVEGDIHLPALPIVPGHQVVGRIVDQGTRVSADMSGMRVGAAWVRKSCGTCRFCKSGKENLCESIEFNGFHENGGYAEYMTVPAEYAYPIPEMFDDISAAPLLCAGIIGYRSLRLAELKPGSSLGLYGFGASAHIALQLAVHRGCRVYVFSRSSVHRELATDLGAAWAGSIDDELPEPLASSVTFAPVGSIVQISLSQLDRGGVFAINANHLSPIPQIEYETLYHERTIRSVANSTRDDAIGFLKEAAEARVNVHTTSYTLEKAVEALAEMKNGTLNGAAVLTL